MGVFISAALPHNVFYTQNRVFDNHFVCVHDAFNTHTFSCTVLANFFNFIDMNIADDDSHKASFPSNSRVYVH